MSALPERYQSYARPHLLHGEVELHDDRDPVVYVPDAYGQMVPMRKSQVPVFAAPSPPRDLAPQPLLDPLAQRMAGGGILGAGAGWGAAQLFNAIAGAGTGLLAFALLLIAARVVGGRQAGTRIEVHNHNRGFGRSTTTL